MPKVSVTGIMKIKCR